MIDRVDPDNPGSNHLHSMNDQNILNNNAEDEVGPFLASMIKMIGAKIIVESGTFTGKTTWHLANAVANLNGMVYTIDVVDVMTQEVRDHKNIKFLLGSSIDVLNEFSSTIDFLFLDSVHKYDYLLDEFGAGHQKLKTGGILAIHDSLALLGVQRFVEYLISRKDYDGITLMTPLVSGRDTCDGICSGISIFQKLKN